MHQPFRNDSKPRLQWPAMATKELRTLTYLSASMECPITVSYDVVPRLGDVEIYEVEAGGVKLMRDADSFCVLDADVVTDIGREIERRIEADAIAFNAEDEGPRRATPSQKRAMAHAEERDYG